MTRGSAPTGTPRCRAARRALAALVGALTLSCGRQDMEAATNRAEDPAPTLGSSTPEVRVGLGQRARAVERQSTARVALPDDDVSSAILEEGPVALAYADPAHAFVLPPGRFLRVNQAAGRVFSASASPQMDVLAPEAAVALGDSIVRLLEGAGWRRVPDEGLGVRGAVVQAARLVTSEGTGHTDVGRWRIPRSQAPWAVVPPDATPYRGEREGVDATLAVRPIKGRSAAAGDPRLLFTLRMEDDRLGGVLFSMVEARRARHGGDMQTLTGWDREPNEAVGAGGPR